MKPEKQFGPLVSAGVLIGVGLGGFLESIVFRQILGTHAFLSAKGPTQNLSGLRSSLLWDGILQFVFLMLVVAGIVVLFRCGKVKDVPWSGQLLFGSWFLGWGIFTLAEGIAFHHVFNLHHLLENANPAAQETGDYAYLGAGVLLGVLGYWAMASTRSELENQERDARRSQLRAKEAAGDRKVYLD